MEVLMHAFKMYKPVLLDNLGISVSTVRIRIAELKAKRAHKKYEGKNAFWKFIMRYVYPCVFPEYCKELYLRWKAAEIEVEIEEDRWAAEIVAHSERKTLGQ